MVREFRKRNNTTPVVLMGYANPVERYDQIHAWPTRGSLCARRGRPAWMACSSWTTRPKNAKPLPPACARTAWT
jgi:hypothetical protein